MSRIVVVTDGEGLEHNVHISDAETAKDAAASLASAWPKLDPGQFKYDEEGDGE